MEKRRCPRDGGNRPGAWMTIKESTLVNNTVEICAMELWDLRARAGLPESRRPALELLLATQNKFFSSGIDGSDIAKNLQLTKTNQIEVDSMLSSLNFLCTEGWIKQENGRLHPSHPDETPPPIFSARLAKSRHRNSIARSTRLRVFAADNGTCWLCGIKTLEFGRDLPEHEDWDAVVDHVKPHSHGGSNRFENLRTCHRWCNITRGARPKPNVVVQQVRVLVRAAFQQDMGEGR